METVVENAKTKILEAVSYSYVYDYEISVPFRSFMAKHKRPMLLYKSASLSRSIYKYNK